LVEPPEDALNAGELVTAGVDPPEQENEPSTLIQEQIVLHEDRIYIEDIFAEGKLMRAELPLVKNVRVKFDERRVLVEASANLL
jgi:hypothetical protein